LILLSHIFVCFILRPGFVFILFDPDVGDVLFCFGRRCILDDPGSNCLQLLGLIGIGYMLCMKSRRHQADITSMSMGLKHRIATFNLSLKLQSVIFIDAQLCF